MDSRDAEKQAQEEALNNLETLIYAVKNAIEDNDIVEFSTDSEREKLSSIVSSAEEWLEDHGSKAKTPGMTRGVM